MAGVAGLAVEADGDEIAPGIPGGKYVRIIVSDDGPGIPGENLERLFDPYFTTKAGREGLGLSIAHSIVSRHHGHIAVESTEHAGTTVTTYLPAAERPAQRIGHADEGKAPPATEEPAQPKRVPPRDDEKIPLPSDDITPPVTMTNLVSRLDARATWLSSPPGRPASCSSSNTPGTPGTHQPAGKPQY